MSSTLQGLGFADAPADEVFMKTYLEAIAPENLIAHPEFTQSLSGDRALVERIHSGMIQPSEAAALLAMPAHQEAAVRAAVSRGFELYTDDAIARGVSYGFGVKDGVRAIDCSGFVKKALDSAALQMGAASCVPAFNAHMATSSEEQIAAAERAGARVLSGSQVNINTLQAGMIIGLDTGHTNFDSERRRGIDHIVMVYRDSDTGRLMVAQSSGGKGVNQMTAESWLQANNQHDLYAVDMVPLARAGSALSAPEPDGQRQSSVLIRSAVTQEM